jgi:small subunit ribosomal protein S14
MAKLAVKLREQNRRKTVAKFKARRQTLLELLQSPRVSDEDKEAARAKLQRLPRDAVAGAAAQPLRAHRAPRGVYRKFGLGRTKLRELALRGEVPGVIKASW